MTEKPLPPKKTLEQSLKVSQHEWKATFDAISDWISIIDVKTGQILETNTAGEKLLGLGRSEIIGQACWALVHGTEEPIEGCPLRKMLKSGKREEMDLTLDGGNKFFSVISDPLRDKENNISTAVHIVRDITGKKQAEETLRLNSEILSNIREAVYMIKLKGGVIVYSNPEFEKMFGYFRGELLGKHVSIVNAPTDKTPEQTAIEIMASIKEEGFWEGRVKNIKKDGTTFWSFARCSLFDHPEHGAVVLDIHLDITQQKRAEDELIASEKRHRGFLENIGAGVIAHAPDTSVLYCNAIAQQLIGFSSDQMLGKSANDGQWQFLNEDGSDALFDDFPVNRALNSRSGLQGYVIGIAHPVQKKIVWVLCSSFKVLKDNGELEHVLITFFDITIRKEALTALEYSNKRYQLVVDNANEAILVHQAGMIVFANPKAIEITGFSQDVMMSASLTDLIHPDDRELVFQNYQNRISNLEAPAIYRFRIIDKDWHYRWIQANSVGISWEEKPAILNFMTDITEIVEYEAKQKVLEAKIRQNQKMESIGNLAGGIAHDFNNILSAIFGFTELSLSELDQDSRVYQNLKEVMVAGIRAKELVKQILAFSRQNEQEMKPLKVSTLVEEVYKMLRSTIPTSIGIYIDDQAERSTVFADVTQIHQVLLNICTNAAHAMEGEGGKLEIGLHNIFLDEDYVEHIPDLIPGDYLQLNISDTGTGIAPEIINQIFEPYFTTKSQMKGTGLGLAVVHGIVKSHNGHITVYSEPGKGTAFNIYFPLIKRAEGHISEKAEETILTGDERILFVDDEISIVKMQRQSLERLGYRVLATNSSTEALAVFKKKPDDFDLVITDMTMPDMSGDRLAKEMKKIRPGIPVILCTGFSGKITRQSAEKMPIDKLLMKPIEKAGLSRAIREVLDAAAD